MTQMHVPNDVLDKRHKNIYTGFLGTENLEQQETKDAVTWDLKKCAMRLKSGSNLFRYVHWRAVIKVIH